ncbi:MAG: GAF domain-containing protein [Rhodanobacteraceae bacterium]
MSNAAVAFLDQIDARLAVLDRELAEAQSMHDVAWVLCEFTGRQLELADVVVYLLDGDGSLSQYAAWGPKRAADHVLESRIRLMPGEGIVGTCAEQGRSLRIVDASQDPRYIRDDQPNRSELAVPIIGNGKLIGVLDSEHPDRDFYDADHERVVLAIAQRGASRFSALPVR